MMKRTVFWYALWLMLAPAGVHAVTLEWPFDVFLDDSQVGSHRFTLNEGEGQRRIESVAQFDVRFLGIDVYQYEHQSLESWQQDCLKEIHARTNDNGTHIEVNGASQPDAFRLTVDGIMTKLPSCIMTFAYWNPKMLEQSHLLNPQTGELIKVTIQNQGQESIKVRDVEQKVNHFYLSSQKFNIDLWYDLEGNWVALDSLIEKNRKLRYRLAQKIKS